MNTKNRSIMGITERKCSRCGKMFVVAPQHIYRKNGKIYCSWTCYNHRNEDRCVSCGEIVPEGRQVCQNCEMENK